MLFDLSIIPVGGDIHTSEEIGKALTVIEASGLPYQLTPVGTCIEGQWEQVMAVIKECHDRLRQSNSHLITTIKIEDDAGEEDNLSHNVASVARKAGLPAERITS
jgi:uncharacterized protein (TIGR00106 family)